MAVMTMPEMASTVSGRGCLHGACSTYPPLAMLLLPLQCSYYETEKKNFLENTNNSDVMRQESFMNTSQVDLLPLFCTYSFIVVDYL